MWHRSAHVCAVVLFIGFATNQVQAAALLLTDDRYVENEISLTYPGGTDGAIGDDSPPVPGADFSVAVVFDQSMSPSQDTVVSSLTSQLSSLSFGRSTSLFFDSLQATGRIIGEVQSATQSESADTRAITTISIDFSIAAPHEYSITGALSQAQDAVGNATVITEASVSLLSLNRGGRVEQTIRGSGPVDQSGLLQPGNYRLEFEATVDTFVSGIGTATGSASFEQMSFELTEVPEPTSIGLLIVGIAIALPRRRFPKAA